MKLRAMSAIAVIAVAGLLPAQALGARYVVHTGAAGVHRAAVVRPGVVGPRVVGPRVGFVTPRRARVAFRREERREDFFNPVGPVGGWGWGGGWGGGFGQPYSESGQWGWGGGYGGYQPSFYGQPSGGYGGSRVCGCFQRW